MRVRVRVRVRARVRVRVRAQGARHLAGGRLALTPTLTPTPTITLTLTPTLTLYNPPNPNPDPSPNPSPNPNPYPTPTPTPPLPLPLTNPHLGGRLREERAGGAPARGRGAWRTKPLTAHTPGALTLTLDPSPSPSPNPNPLPNTNTTLTPTLTLTNTNTNVKTNPNASANTSTNTNQERRGSTAPRWRHDGAAAHTCSSTHTQSSEGATRYALATPYTERGTGRAGPYEAGTGAHDTRHRATRGTPRSLHTFKQYFGESGLLENEPTGYPQSSSRHTTTRAAAIIC